MINKTGIITYVSFVYRYVYLFENTISFIIRLIL